jgi:hypothetical protein
MDLGIADDGERTRGEQAAQIAITLFADTAELVLAPDRPAVARCAVAAASPARTSSTSCSVVKPCASISASVQPSEDAASSSSARLRSGVGRRRTLRLIEEGGMVARLRSAARIMDSAAELAAFQLIELHSVPASQGQIAGYRTGEDQSGANGTILRPVSRRRRQPRSELGHKQTSLSPRPCPLCPQEQELAPLHSITSSARASSLSGTSRPSALAVLRLMTNSNFVGRSTGRSPAFSPLRILSTSRAASRAILISLAP